MSTSDDPQTSSRSRSTRRPRRCHDLTKLAGGLRPPASAHLEDTAQGFGEALAAAARLLGGCGEFLGEERVSSDRRTMESTRAVPGGAPAIPSAVRRVRPDRTAPRGRGPRRAAGARLSEPRINGWRRCSSSLGTSRSSQALVTRVACRNASRSRVERSAQCMSSITSRTGVVHRACRKGAVHPRRSGSGAIRSAPAGGNLGTNRRPFGDQSDELWQARSGGLGDHIGIRPGGPASKELNDSGRRGARPSQKA